MHKQYWCCNHSILKTKEKKPCWSNTEALSDILFQPLPCVAPMQKSNTLNFRTHHPFSHGSLIALCQMAAEARLKQHAQYTVSPGLRAPKVSYTTQRLDFARHCSGWRVHHPPELVPYSQRKVICIFPIGSGVAPALR